MNIDWITKIITIDKVDMVQIQSTPTEIWQLDIPAFRLFLKDREDDNDGIQYPDTHSHNTTVEVSGAVLARVVEMINGYTITFEDGQYAVNLVGANSNLGDVVNVNQVSIRTANSAGLQDLTSLQAASFKEGQVAIDVVNGFAGTVFPTGTLGRPCNNVQDAVAIAKEAGMDALYVIGALTLSVGDDVSSFRITGQNPINSSLVLEDGATIDKCDIRECSVSGVLDDNCVLRSCLLLELTYVNGFVLDSGLTESPIVLGENSFASFVGCYSVVATSGSTAVIDFNHSNQNLIFRNFTGEITFKNHSYDSSTALDFHSGWVIIDSSCTEGDFYIRGVAELQDESSVDCTVHTLGKATVGKDLDAGVEAVWDYHTRTLTESGQGTSPEEIWTYATRTLTQGISFDEGEFHDALDSYSNKDNWTNDPAVIELIKEMVYNKVTVSSDKRVITVYDDTGTVVKHILDVSADLLTRIPRG